MGSGDILGIAVVLVLQRGRSSNLVSVYCNTILSHSVDRCCLSNIHPWFPYFCDMVTLYAPLSDISCAVNGRVYNLPFCARTIPQLHNDAIYWVYSIYEAPYQQDYTLTLVPCSFVLTPSAVESMSFLAPQKIVHYQTSWGEVSSFDRGSTFQTNLTDQDTCTAAWVLALQAALCDILGHYGLLLSSSPTTDRQGQPDKMLFSSIYTIGKAVSLAPLGYKFWMLVAPTGAS